MATKKPTTEKSVPKKAGPNEKSVPKKAGPNEKSVPKKAGPNGGAREGAGRKPFEPTDAERKQVEALSGYGLPIEHIAVLVREGIDTDTLRKHFSSELISGKAKANGQVGKTLFQKVMAGDTTAAIWWTKTQMRWKEVQHYEYSGVDGAPMKTQQEVRVTTGSPELSHLSVAEMEEIKKKLYAKPAK